MAFADLIKKYAVQPEYSDDLLALQPQEAHEEDPNTQAVVAPKEEVKTPMKRASDDNEARRASTRADIEKLLKDFDEADHAQKRGNIVAGLSEAGMEFGHAFGGEPVDKEWSKGIRERAGESKKNVLTKERLKQDVSEESRKEGDYVQKQGMNNQKMDETGLDIDKKEMANQNEKSLMDAKSPESSAVRGILGKYGIQVPESADARSILSVYPFVKEDFDAQVADKRIKAEAENNQKNRNNAWGIASMHEKGQTERNDADNATSALNATLRQQGKEFLGGMKAQDRLQKLYERNIDGLEFNDKESGIMIPSEDSAKKTRDLKGAVGALNRVGNQALAILQKRQANIPWTTDWNNLMADWQNIANEKVKIDENGVMNVNDMASILKEIGDPNTAGQVLAGSAKDRLTRSLANANGRYAEKIGPWGYRPGKMTKEDFDRYTGGYSGGGTGSGSSGPTNRVSPEAVDELGKKAVGVDLGVGQAKGQPQKTGHGKVVSETARVRRYEDGYREAK